MSRYRLSSSAAAALVLFAFIFAVRVWQMTHKHEMHPDEVYSVMISRCNPLFYQSPPDGVYSGAALASMLADSHSMGEDLTGLWRDNADVPHASLYYMMLRVVTDSVDSWNPDAFIRIGGTLNLMLMALAYLLMYRLGNLLFPGRRWAVLAMLALGFGSQSAGDCVLLLREYQLAATAIIWLVWEMVAFMEKRGSTALSAARLILPTVVALSAGYLNAWFLLLAYGASMVWLFASGQRKAAMMLPAVAIIGLLAAVAIYPGFFNFLLHSNPHTRLAFINFSSTMSQTFSRDIVGQTFTVTGLIAIAVAGAVTLWQCRRCGNAAAGGRRRLAIASAVILAALLTVCMVQYTSVLKEVRYSYPFLPLLALIVPVALYGWRGKAAVTAGAALTFFYAGVSITRTPTLDYGWVQRSRHLKHPATLYCLNPNEVSLAVPMLNPYTDYLLTSDTKRSYTSWPSVIVHYKSDKVDRGLYAVVPLTGPLNLLVRK